MKLDLSDHKTVILGIQESGKTHLAKRLLHQFRRPVVYRMNYDFESENVYLYVPTNPQGELEAFCGAVLDRAEREDAWDVVVFDEADQLFRNYQSFGAKTLKLLGEHRHAHVALIFLARRPQDLPPYIVESAKHLIVFKLEGANALNRLDEVYPGFSTMVEGLDFDKHDWLYKRVGKPPVKMPPVRD